MRHFTRTLIFGPALVFAAACSKPADPTLSNDLTLAAQARQNATLDSITAAERIRSNASAVRSNNYSTHRSTSSGGNVATERRTVTDKNTKRDAAIGAAAGAIIGATASHDKLKGGLIGAAAGGLLGGVIGNNVDIKKKKVP
jgi:uncharacterized protein YcfJ